MRTRESTAGLRALALLAVASVVLSGLLARALLTGEEAAERPESGRGSDRNAEGAQAARPTEADPRTDVGVARVPRASDEAAAARIVLLECLAGAQREDRSACIEDAREQLSPKGVLGVLCDPQLHLGAGDRQELLGELLLTTPPEEALELLVDLCAHCRVSSQRTHDFRAALRRAFERDPLWRARFLASLAPQELFATGNGDCVGHLLGNLVRDGARELLPLAEAVARGDHRAPLGARTEALLAAFFARWDRRERLTFLDEVLTTGPDDQRRDLTSLVVALLLNPESWPERDARPALDRVERLVADPVLGERATMAVLRNGTASRPPEGVDAERWTSLWDACEAVARRRGGVIGGTEDGR